MCSSLILFLIRYFRCHILADITYGLGILSLFLLLTPFFCGQVLILQLSKACGNLAIQFNKLCSLTKRFRDILFTKVKVMKNSLAEPTTGWSSSPGQLWPSPPRRRQGREDPRSVVVDQAGARAACGTKKSGYFNRFSRNQEYNRIKPNITPLKMC